MELYEHQKNFLCDDHKKHLLCWDMGTGKTRTAIEWAKLREGKTLIIVPKGLVENWQRECEKWGYDYFNIISKENFKKKVYELDKYDNIIVDEAHYFAGASQMNKSLMAYIKMWPDSAIILLTGTPYMRNAWNVYRLGHILGRTDWKYRQFDFTFFNMVRMGQRVIPVQKQDLASKELLATYVNDIGSTKHLSECADVPVSQEYAEKVQITKSQLVGCMELQDFEPIVRFTKEQQIMGGYMKGDEFSPDENFTSNKRTKLQELVGQNDKIMIVCRYTHEIRELEEFFKKQKRNVFTLHGGVKDRDDVVQKARTSDDCVLIVGAQMSEGWEIPEIETMIFYSHSFSLKDYMQMKGRIQRINDLRPRCYIHLVVEKSVDEGILDSLMNKKDFLAHIYAKTGSKTYHPS